MFFLEQIKEQFILSLSAQNGEGAAAALDQHYEQNQAANDNSAPGPDEQKIPQTAETLAFQELNEELDAIDNDSGQITEYISALGAGLIRVERGDYPGLSSEDSDYIELLAKYTRKFEYLKQMQQRGHEIEGELQTYIKDLDKTVDRGFLDGTEPGMAEVIRKQEDKLEKDLEKQEKLEGLETQRTSLVGILRDGLGEISSKDDNFGKYSSQAQIIIKLAEGLIDTKRESSNEIINRETGDIIDGDPIQVLKSEIAQLEEVHFDLAIVLENETIPGNEKVSDVAATKIESEFNRMKENGSEIVKEIIGEKDFLDFKKGDFMRLWLEGDVDLRAWLTTDNNTGVGESGVGDSFTMNFGGNPVVGSLLASIVPISAQKITIDGKTATRSGERDFTLEGGGPVSIKDGSEVIISKNEVEISPEKIQTRLDSYRESMQSNVTREDFERVVHSQIEQREMNGEENEDGWLATIIKKAINMLAGVLGEETPFPEVLEKEKELYEGYSQDDMNRIEQQGMRRFSPDGQELLQDTEFMSGLSVMCDRLGVQRDDMLIVMQAESKLDPKAINPVSKASGLIQFMPKTAVGLGTSILAIQNMSAVEQLVYVEKYFERYAGKMNSVADIYRVVFYPVSIGKPADWVMGSQNGTARKVADQNGPGITKHSRRSDGLIDNATFDRYVAAKISQFSTIVATSRPGNAPSFIQDEGIGEVAASIRSEPAKVITKPDGSKMTYCSETARLNLSKLGVSAPKWGNSAKTSFQEYGSDKISGFPPSDTNATVADLYCDASKGKEEFGHRAACVKINGEWFVLDPYYKIPGYESTRTSPIPADAYLNHMQNKLGRNIWGAAYFS